MLRSTARSPRISTSAVISTTTSIVHLPRFASPPPVISARRSNVCAEAESAASPVIASNHRVVIVSPLRDSLDLWRVVAVHGNGDRGNRRRYAWLASWPPGWFPAISRWIASSTPFTNCTDSSVENFRASSSASSMVTAAGVPPHVHFVDRQAQDIAVHGGHALHAPVLGVARDQPVHFGRVVHGAAHQARPRRRRARAVPRRSSVS